MVTELINAVKAGDTASVQRMLAAGADVNSRDGEGSTLLMLAAHAGDLPMVKVLIEGGADVNACDERGWSPLAKAVYNAELKRGFADVVKALIDAGANIEAAIGYGVRPLMLAAGYGETEVVEALLNAGADVLARNEGGLHRADDGETETLCGCHQPVARGRTDGRSRGGQLRQQECARFQCHHFYETSKRVIQRVF